MIDTFNDTYIQGNFFFQPIFQQIDHSHSLVRLAHEINWDAICKVIGGFYSEIGRRGLPIRRMVGLLIIKQMYNLSDEEVVKSYIENPYIQYFCGNPYYTTQQPCSDGMLTVFRRRIGTEGVQLIFNESVKIHGNKVLEEDSVVVDSTVQPKNITYPTPTKLLVKVINYCLKFAKKFNIKLSKQYLKLLKVLLRTLRFEKSSKKAKEVRKAKKQLRSIAISVLRDFEKALSEDLKLTIQDKLDIYHKVISQTQPKTLYFIEKNAANSIKEFAKFIGFAYKLIKELGIVINSKCRDSFKECVSIIKNEKGKGKKQRIAKQIDKMTKIAETLLDLLDKKMTDEQKASTSFIINKLHLILKNQKNLKKNLCSIHEPGVACIAKGKEGKKFEFGSKSSFVITKGSCVIVGVKDFQGNPHDSTTLKPSLDVTTEATGHRPKNAFTDRGYRGAKDLGDTVHHIPSSPKPSDSESDKETARKNFGRRSAIEPVIGHLKSDFRLARNYLKGAFGDAINALLASAAFNFQKWCNKLNKPLTA